MSDLDEFKAQHIAACPAVIYLYDGAVIEGDKRAAQETAGRLAPQLAARGFTPLRRTEPGQSLRLYLAGPMRGYRDDNRKAFDFAAERLRAAGHEVLVPYEYDRKFPEWNLRQHFGGSVQWLCAHADGVALLAGWRKSRGTQAEVACAAALDIPVKAWVEWLPKAY